MKALLKHIIVPIIFFVIFVIAGTVGLMCESWLNDLAFSTTAFLTAFASMTGIVWHTYHSIF